MRPALAAVLVLPLLAPQSAGSAPAGPYWPEFHGPARDNISRETGLMKAWPAGGPPLVWKRADCGRGYSGVTIAGGLLFTSGDFGDDEALLAFDLDGKPAWRAVHGRAWKGPQPGARAAPTWNDGLLYHLNPHGLLSCLEATTGRTVWSADLVKRFGARVGSWGFTESVIVEGDRLFCMPGGTEGRVVALDRKTGATVWANTEIRDRAAYASPILVTHNGVRQFITLARESVIGVDAATGRLLWSHGHPSTCDQNVTSPIYHDGGVFVTSGHRAGARVARLSADGKKVEETWYLQEFDNCHGGVILLDGYLYGSGCRLYERGLVCVEFATGRKAYNAREIGKVSVTYADGRLYCLGNDASMALVDVNPQRATGAGKFTPPWKNPAPCLSHPVVCGGRLYVRHLNELFAYDVREKR
jgi:outer membrane protein assembly factor BamB